MEGATEMESANILEMTGICKSFSGVRALNGASIVCSYGEVHALLGENGAGKSTLMKILSAAYQPDQGEIKYKGTTLTHQDPIAIRNAGIGIIYQEFNLVPELTVAENIFLGRELAWGGFIDKKSMNREAAVIFEKLGVSIDVNIQAKRLSVAEQQMVEIAKALSFNADLIVMDEPTATLTTHEIEFLFKTIRRLKSEGKTFIYISHRLEEIFAICDRVTVLKDGGLVGSRTVSEIDKDGLINMMVGRTLSDYYPPRDGEKGQKVLEVLGLTRRGAFQDVSFDAYSGEILGFFGLIGAGRTEVVRAIFGAERAESGKVSINGKPIVINNPVDAIAHEIGFATEDRKSQGLILGLSVKKNISLPILGNLIKFGFLQLKKEIKLANSLVQQLHIAIRNLDVAVGFLSGGNQQKVVLAKWLARDCNILILDEPTRGIDVGAKAEIYLLMRALAKQGKTIIMISSELLEVIGVSDRILIMNQGSIVAEMPAIDATEEKIMQYAIGGGK